MASRQSVGIVPVDSNILKATFDFDMATADVAVQAAEAMVDKFGDHGLRDEDLGVIAVDKTHVLMNVADVGLGFMGEGGDWTPEEDFIVSIKGESVDTRSKMTDKVYRAFVAAAMLSGREPPDSPYEGEQGLVEHPMTWLTGEGFVENLEGPDGALVIGRICVKYGYVDVFGRPVTAHPSKLENWSSALRQIRSRQVLDLGALMTK